MFPRATDRFLVRKGVHITSFRCLSDERLSCLFPYRITAVFLSRKKIETNIQAIDVFIAHPFAVSTKKDSVVMKMIGDLYGKSLLHIFEANFHLNLYPNCSQPYSHKIHFCIRSVSNVITYSYLNAQQALSS